MTEKEYGVKVIRNGNMIEVTNRELVPGDVYMLGKQIPCDSIVLSGDVLVN